MAPVSEIFQLLESSLPLHSLAWDGPLGRDGHKEAGVLVALTSEAQPRVILGRRAMHLTLHPGEVAFPGGKREAGDATPWATALRETMEEVGLPAEDIHPLGELAPLITRSRFEVYPCIARVPAELDLVVDPGEFDSVFMPPLQTFADPELFRLETMWDGEHTRRVPHYQLGEDNVWGVTAAILAQLANLAYDAGFDLQRNWKEKP
jgi:8-oxo-dGTP pyrophosphatase MutT (NUDIX family)